jgi:hypothetical protein
MWTLKIFIFTLLTAGCLKAQVDFETVREITSRTKAPDYIKWPKFNTSQISVPKEMLIEGVAKLKAETYVLNVFLPAGSKDSWLIHRAIIVYNPWGGPMLMIYNQCWVQSRKGCSQDQSAFFVDIGNDTQEWSMIFLQAFPKLTEIMKNNKVFSRYYYQIIVLN